MSYVNLSLVKKLIIWDFNFMQHVLPLMDGRHSCMEWKIHRLPPHSVSGSEYLRCNDQNPHCWVCNFHTDRTWKRYSALSHDYRYATSYDGLSRYDGSNARSHYPNFGISYQVIDIVIPVISIPYQIFPSVLHVLHRILCNRLRGIHLLVASSGVSRLIKTFWLDFSLV